MTSDDRTIYQRIADAYRDIAAETFTKDSKVPGFAGYNYIPVAQMLAIVRSAHSKHGIITLFGRPEYDPEHGEKRYTYKRVKDGKDGKEGKETTWTYANGHVHVVIYGANGDCVETDVPCEAQDNSDKLDNLLMTNAQRSLYRTLYAIDEGKREDPEEYNIEIAEKDELTEAKMSEGAPSAPKVGAGSSTPEGRRIVKALTMWMFDDADERVLKIVMPQTNAKGPLDSWGLEDLRAVFEECKAAREVA